MKLQAASRKEVSRIAIGVLVCDCIMIAALFLLSLVGVGTFNPTKILLGALCGSVIAIVNFIILCLTIQSALDIENKRKMKARFQLSYNIRMVVQAVWVVAAFIFREKIHFVAAAAPVLFPNVVILFLQFTGRLMPKNQSAAPAEDAETPDAEEASDSEESN